MTVKFKKGDIVFLNGWDGVIGRVVSFDERSQTIVLEWPKDFSPYHYSNPQPFSAADFNVLKMAEVLSANQVFEYMLKFLADKLELATEQAKSAVEEAIGRI